MSNKPKYTAFVVEQTKEEKGFWHKVGVAFEHKDGKGLNIDLFATPTDGKIVLREYREKPEQGQDEK